MYELFLLLKKKTGYFTTMDAQDFHMLLFGTDTHVEKKCATSASSDQICLFDIAISTSNEIAIFRALSESLAT